MDATPAAGGSARCGGRTLRSSSRRVDIGACSWVNGDTGRRSRSRSRKPEREQVLVCDSAIDRDGRRDRRGKPMRRTTSSSPAQVQAALTSARRGRSAVTAACVPASEVSARTRHDQRRAVAGTGTARSCLSMLPAMAFAVKAGTVANVHDDRPAHSRRTRRRSGPPRFSNKLAIPVPGSTRTSSPRRASTRPTIRRSARSQVSPSSHGERVRRRRWARAGTRTTPLPVSQRIQFRTPGTYHYICLIHSFRKGTIIVH